MAEERLIDDDKDRKYKIRKNADGEDELYIDEEPEEEEEEELGFEVPVFDADDEEAAVMTPEQLAARERARVEEEERRKNALAAAINRAEELLSEADYAGALQEIEKVETPENDNGALCVLKLRALSKNMTDFSLAEECAAAAEAARDSADGEQLNGLLALADPLVKKTAALEEEVRQLQEENEEKKSQRRGILVKRFKKSLIGFAATTVPLLVFLILTACFASVMHTAKDGSNIVLTIVFAALAGVCFLATLFTAHKLWESRRNVRLNEKNTSTKLGREYEEKHAYLAQLKRIYAALKVDL